MSDNLPVINYTGPTPGKQKTYLDASTLSRIRSHAQQAVQDQKWSNRAKNVQDKAAIAAKKASLEAAKQHPSKSMRGIFELQSGKEIQRPPTQKRTSRRGAVKVKGSVSDGGNTKIVVIKRESHSLSASPAERPDPFASFPVRVDAEFMNLFRGYYLSWKWANQPPELLFRENMWHPALAHSFLAMANTVWRSDDQKRRLHENQTFLAVGKGLPELSSLEAGHQRSELACALTWSIIRLATIEVNLGRLETSLQHLNALNMIDRKDWDYSKFAVHFQAAIASLLLANFAQSHLVKPLLHLPFGHLTTWAADDVEAQGFSVPSSALMRHLVIQQTIQPRVSDAILGLTALYNIRDDAENSDNSLPHVHSGLRASSAVKIALRLAQHSTPASSPINHSWAYLAEFQECVRLTALLWTWTFGRRLLNRSDAIFSAQRYTRAFLTPRLLLRILADTSGAKAMIDLITWMLLVCGSASFTDDDRIYYAELTRNVVPEAQSARYAEIRRLGEVMPWIEPPNRSPAEEFWDIVTTGGHVTEFNGGGTLAGPMLLGFVSVSRTPLPSPMPIREVTNDLGDKQEDSKHENYE